MALRVLFCLGMMYGMASSDLGLRIRRAREAKRLSGKEMTQADLARLLGVSARTVGRWENEGTIPRGSIGALEQVLGISLAEDVDPRREQLKAALADLVTAGLLAADRAQDLLDEYDRDNRPIALGDPPRGDDFAWNGGALRAG